MDKEDFGKMTSQKRLAMTRQRTLSTHYRSRKLILNSTPAVRRLGIRRPEGAPGTMTDSQQRRTDKLGRRRPMNPSKGSIAVEPAGLSGGIIRR